MPANFWDMQFKDFISFAILVATIVAIIVGPIFAVRATHKSEEKRAARRRKAEIFTALMKTRAFTLASDHVSALNLIQVEFYEHSEVITAYKAYINDLSKKFPKEAAEIDPFLRLRRDAFFELVAEIGKVLGTTFDKRDLEKFSYSPVAWENDEAETRQSRQLLIPILKGEKALWIASEKPSQVPVFLDDFPPPPE